jgi:uncharacterized protein involved in exopolysaccharide biosynthesis
MKASEIVAAAVQAALRAKDGRTSDSDLDAAAEHAKAPDTLRKRIDDLEKDLATVNRRLSAMNAAAAALEAPLSAAERSADEEYIDSRMGPGWTKTLAAALRKCDGSTGDKEKS